MNVRKTRHQVSYQKVIDGYDVTDEYRGSGFQIGMPCVHGKYIKMRIQFAPVI